MKKALSVFLCLLLLFLFPVRSLAEEAEDAADEPVTIRSAEEFIRFAEGCSRDSYSAGKVFVLEANIDLTGLPFSPVPYFAGSFDGKQHTVSGFHFESDGSRQGFFRVVTEGAVITGLHVEGSMTPGGTASDIGGLVGVNSGTISTCSFRGNVSGIENVGGIVGRNTPSGVVSGCFFRGSLTGEHQVGGIVGQNDGILSSCVNMAEINTISVTPVETDGTLFSGAAHFDISQLSEDDFLNLSNIGGIAGSSTGIVDHCRNDAPVGYHSTGYNVGGICGKSSGFVAFCRNHAEINGRRDVGGIVGQLIPFSDWDLSSGKLDALSWQISILNGYLNGMTRNFSSYSKSMIASLNRLQANTQALTDALQNIMDVAAANDQKIIDSITIDPETGEIHFEAPSFDNADASAITTSLSNMYAEISVLTDLAKKSTGSLASDLNTVSGQLTNVFNALFSTVSSLGNVEAETADLSETDAYTRNTGAIADCVNLGAVVGENNCGGILGISSFEVEFDMEDRLSVTDYLTSNARQDLFAAVRSCTSTSDVESKNNGAGGIVGDMDIGTVIACSYAGSVSARSGDYVGGLVGISAGSVLNSWACSLLSGNKFVGGAVGYGAKIQGCRIWTHIVRQNEYAGAVAGWADGPVLSNCYIDSAPAGVDGISIAGEADPLTEEELLALEGVPDHFGTVTVTFRVNGSVVATKELPFGGELTEAPAVENRDGSFWVWELPEQRRLYASVTVDGNYHVPSGTIATPEDPPLYLVEGLFYDGQELLAEAITPPEVDGELLNSVRLSVTGYEEELTVRMLNTAEGTLYRISEDGELSELPYSRDGSYLVFRIPNGSSFCYVENSLRSDLHRLSGRSIIAIAAGLVFVLVLIVSLTKRSRTRSKQECSDVSPEASAVAPQEAMQGCTVSKSDLEPPDSAVPGDGQDDPSAAETRDPPISP